MGHQPPTAVEDPAPVELERVVEGLRPHLGQVYSVGDPIWQLRWEGELPLVALDARKRSVSDLRQRLVRTLHELDLRHLPRTQRRLLAVVLAPEGAAASAAWGAQLHALGDDGLSGDWRRLRHRVALLVVETDGSHRLHEHARFAQAAVTAWEAGLPG